MPTAIGRVGARIDAVKETHRLLCRGYTDVVDADLSKYFDTIPHADLLQIGGLPRPSTEIVLRG